MSTAPVDTQEQLHQSPPVSEVQGAATAAPSMPAGATDEHVADEEPADADDLARAVAERDEYLEALQRLQAEYDNYRRRMQRDLTDAADRGGRQVAERLLETLDAFDAAVEHGMDALVPLRRSLLDALQGAGLQRLQPAEEAFDPAEHHAVAHDPADEPGPPTVAQVLRPGYRWKDRLIRPALVHVKG